MPPPTTTKTDPPVTAIAFAVTRELGLTNKGSPADNAAKINRLIPNAIKTTTVSATPVVPVKTNSATINKLTLRKKLEKNSARCLEILSNTVPTKGPTIEYGNRTTANPSAAFRAFVWRSGENRTKDAKALWKIPSVICPDQRTAKRRENLGCLSKPIKPIRKSVVAQGGLFL